MKDKLKKIIVLVIMCISVFTIPVFAKTEKVDEPIFMGKVLISREK